MMTSSQMEEILGEESQELLEHQCTCITKDQLVLPGPNWVDQVFGDSDRNIRVLRSLHSLFNHGRLAGTGYLSILPVDQGVEHSAGASFAPNPIYFNPENIVRLAIEAGCNGVASTLGVLGSVARKYAHKIPFILKINHNELLSCPNQFDQVLYANVHQAHDLGAVAVGATVYYGSPESHRQLQEISEAFAIAHELGMATILWCYLRNPNFKHNGTDFHDSADLTGQANYLGSTIGADIVKQKLPTRNYGYKILNEAGTTFGKFHEGMYSQLCSDNPIDLCRYQLMNCYAGRVGLINSGGSSGKNDEAQAIKTAIINKRAGGMGLISGRKTFQKPMEMGIRLFHAIQDVYLNDEISIA